MAALAWVYGLAALAAEVAAAAANAAAAAAEKQQRQRRLQQRHLRSSNGEFYLCGDCNGFVFDRRDQRNR